MPEANGDRTEVGERPAQFTLPPVDVVRVRARLLAVTFAALGASLVAVLTGLIDNPVFGPEVPPIWWSWPPLLISAVLTGRLAATYGSNRPDTGASDALGDVDAAIDRAGRTRGGVGGPADILRGRMPRVQQARSARSWRGRSPWFGSSPTAHRKAEVPDGGDDAWSWETKRTGRKTRE